MGDFEKKDRIRRKNVKNTEELKKACLEGLKLIDEKDDTGLLKDKKTIIDLIVETDLKGIDVKKIGNMVIKILRKKQLMNLIEMLKKRVGLIDCYGRINEILFEVDYYIGILEKWKKMKYNMTSKMEQDIEFLTELKDKIKESNNYNNLKEKIEEYIHELENLLKTGDFRHSYGYYEKRYDEIQKELDIFYDKGKKLLDFIDKFYNSFNIEDYRKLEEKMERKERRDKEILVSKVLPKITIGMDAKLEYKGVTYEMNKGEMKKAITTSYDMLEEEYKARINRNFGKNVLKGIASGEIDLLPISIIEMFAKNNKEIPAHDLIQLYIDQCFEDIEDKKEKNINSIDIIFDFDSLSKVQGNEMDLSDKMLLLEKANNAVALGNASKEGKFRISLEEKWISIFNKKQLELQQSQLDIIEVANNRIEQMKTKKEYFDEYIKFNNNNNLSKEVREKFKQQQQEQWEKNTDLEFRAGILYNSIRGKDNFEEEYNKIIDPTNKEYDDELKKEIKELKEYEEETR